MFLVKENAILILKKTIFKSNIQRQSNFTSCIIATKKSNVYIANCGFLNHTSIEYPHSAKLIHTEGNLTMTSSKFKNNRIDNENRSCINVSK